MDKIAANEHAQSPQPTRKNGSGECMIGRDGAERGLGVAGKGGGTKWRWMLDTGLGRGTREGGWWGGVSGATRGVGHEARVDRCEAGPKRMGRARKRGTRGVGNERREGARGCEAKVDAKHSLKDLPSTILNTGTFISPSFQPSLPFEFPCCPPLSLSSLPISLPTA